MFEWDFFFFFFFGGGSNCNLISIWGYKRFENSQIPFNLLAQKALNLGADRPNDLTHFEVRRLRLRGRVHLYSVEDITVTLPTHFKIFWQES